MPENPLKVFICHSSGDKPAIRDLYYWLQNKGFAPWLDEESLLPGQDWRYEIPKAVRCSDVVLVCLSKDSITKSGYVQKEIKFALDIADEQPEGTIFIIPLRLEECDVPERLGVWQWVNLYEEKGYDKLLRSLLLRSEGISNLPPTINHSSSAPQQNSEPQQSPVKKPLLSSTQIKIILTLIPVVGSLIAAYWQFVYKTDQVRSSNTFQYIGRVVDVTTQQVLKGAKITVEASGPPQIYYTNTDGYFYIDLDSHNKAGRLRVEASNYEPFDRDVSFSRTGVEDIRLSPQKSSPPPLITPTATPTQIQTKGTNRSARQSQNKNIRHHDSNEAIDILLGRKPNSPR